MTTFFMNRKREEDKKIIRRINSCQNMAEFDRLYEEIEALNNGFLERNQGIIEMAQDYLLDKENNSLSNQFRYICE